MWTRPGVRRPIGRHAIRTLLLPSAQSSPPGRMIEAVGGGRRVTSCVVALAACWAFPNPALGAVAHQGNLPAAVHVTEFRRRLDTALGPEAAARRSKTHAIRRWAVMGCRGLPRADAAADQLLTCRGPLAHAGPCGVTCPCLSRLSGLPSCGTTIGRLVPS